MATISQNQSILSVGVNQSTRTITIGSVRGTIYDRNLVPLVNNTVRYCGVLYPESSLIQKIREDMTDAEYRRLLESLDSGNLLVANLSKASYLSKGLRTFEIPVRYSEKVSCAHLLGYLDNSSSRGITGIEKAYDAVLNDAGGSISVTYSVNGVGRCLSDEPLKINSTLSRSKAGVMLTIDAKWQRLLDDVAGQYLQKGAVTVLDANTGELLACASLPDYHPNQLQESIEQNDGALVNRLCAQFDCGSVFKLITAAAGLENGIHETKTYHCDGQLTIGNNVFHCHQRLGHQSLNMEQALAQSCNLYFIQLAQEIGAEALLNTAGQLGLMDSIEIAPNLTVPATYLPTKDTITPAALANLSIGQGELLISPLHVAQMTATIANGGVRYPIRAVIGTTNKEGSITAEEKGRGVPCIEPEIAEKLRQMMECVVTDGTGKRAQPEADFTAAGKTGTAETGQYNENRPVIQSWFTGYFPADNPQYVITILAEDAENLGGDALGLFKELSTNIYK